MYDCETKDDRIVSIYCVQETTEMRYQLYAPVFVDATGNGTLGYYAGAEYRKGSEPQSEFGELHAPQQPNNYRMGNSILLKAKDMGHPVKFTPPSFAKKLTEEQLAKRIHCVQMRDTSIVMIRPTRRSISGPPVPVWIMVTGGWSFVAMERILLQSMRRFVMTSLPMLTVSGIILKTIRKESTNTMQKIMRWNGWEHCPV